MDDPGRDRPVGTDGRTHLVGDVASGTVLADRYRLSTPLRQTEDSQLWLADDATLDREVTVTIFNRSLSGAAAAMDSARRAAAVEDPHLVRVLDVGDQDDLTFIISEALHRTDSLAALAQLGPLPAEEVRRIVGEAAVGLGTADSRGLHHLQLTPHAIERAHSGSVSVRGLAIEAALAGTDDVPAAEASRIDTVDLVRCLYTGLTGQWPGDTEVPGLPNAERGDKGRLKLPGDLVPGVPSDLDRVVEQVLIDDAGPTTPTALAHLLSPWSSEIVHSVSGEQAAAARRVAVSGSGPRTLPPPADPTDPDATMVGRHPELENDETHTFNAAALALAAPKAAPAKHQEEYDDLEPPLPLMPDGYTEPDGQTSRLALVIVAGLVVIALVLGLLGLKSVFDRGSSLANTLPGGSTSSSTTPGVTKTTAARPTGQQLKVADIVSYDPEGNDDEHNDLAQRAIDGRPGTSWMTHIWPEETFTNTKKQGAGLLLTLQGKQQVSRVQITVVGNPTTIQVFVGDQPDKGSATQLGTLNNGSGVQNVSGGPLQGQYVILWITKLSAYQDGYRDQISDIKIYS